LTNNFRVTLGIRYELTTLLTAVNGKVVDLRIPTDLQITLGNPLYRPILGDPSEWFNAAAFVQQSAGFHGNVGRNTLIGPNLGEFDFTTSKTFRMRENCGLEFRGDTRSLTNHPNWVVPLNTTSYNVSGGDTVFADAGGKPVGNAGRSSARSPHRGRLSCP
jgi:hypothetical protein